MHTDTTYESARFLKLVKAVEQITGRPYNMTVQVYTDNTYAPVAENCFAFMFTNVGDTTAKVKGMVIYPSTTPTTSLGDSRTVCGHKGDIFKGTIDILFEITVVPAIVTGRGVELVQLYYTD
jgi:hypothetical protein